MDDAEAERAYREAAERGLELARNLASERDKTAASAITLGTAAGALYLVLSSVKGYQDDAKSWLDAFFLTMTGGLKKQGIHLSVSWERKD